MVKNINFGGNIIERNEFGLDDLLDDEIEQIVMSNTLFKAFDNSSKFKEHYDSRKLKKLFKHVVYLYNDSTDTMKYRSINIPKKDC